MTDDQHVLANLAGDQLAERARALLLEAEYWQHVLDDGSTINDSLLAATDAVIETTQQVTMLMLTPAAFTAESGRLAVAANRKALYAIGAAGDALGALLELADGRQKALQPTVAALRVAAGLDQADDGDELGGDAA